MRRRGGGTKEGVPPEMRRRGLPGRRPAIPGLGRCGARGPVSQTGTRPTAGLRPRPLMGLRQELADRGPTLDHPPKRGPPSE